MGVELGFKARAQRTIHVLGNWKMNLTLEQAVGLLERLAARKELNDCGAVVGVIPSHPYLVLASAPPDRNVHSRRGSRRLDRGSGCVHR